MYKPKYSITNKILKNIGSIEASKEVIDHAPLLPYFEKEFRQDAIVRSVHFGTHIEGNELNLSQAEKVLQGQEVIARDRDIQEVINYRKVLEYISSISKDAKINEEIIKKIHGITVDKILDSSQQGTYRKTQVVVKNSHTGEISFRPPLAVHVEFVRIHPFLDGNGRVARAFATLILFLKGYDIRKFFSLEEYFDKDASSYYEALQSVEKNDGDLTKWLEYFTFGLSVELSKIREKVESISIDARLKEKLGGKPILLSPRQLKLIGYIQKIGYLQNQAFESLFPMISEDTILNELKGLLKAGIIKKHGVTKGAKYIMA